VGTIKERERKKKIRSASRKKAVTREKSWKTHLTGTGKKIPYPAASPGTQKGEGIKEGGGTPGNYREKGLWGKETKRGEI